METKLKNVIKSMENRIEWEQELIDRHTEDIREYAKSRTPEDIAMFLPSKIRELEDAINRKKGYAEQLNMLQFIQKEN